MNSKEITIRNANSDEFDPIGELMVKVYSRLEGFPSQSDQPDYYKMLLNVGKLTDKENTELIVAVSEENVVIGAVVYFSDMKNYGSGGIAIQIKNSSGFRLLAVNPNSRGQGIGKLLCQACINKTKKLNQRQLVIHSTAAMKIAWSMYEKMGFERYSEIDFKQGELPIFGFKLKL